ncbi:hypothetical protein JL09_g1994 [Pichia kudriavzevii]|uniref:Importin N-terminal domain-containing protein n=1 Tax=Pichia kudriavzevii TaxID=4909 RepID=A0A099P3M8_PICKU|nr:hypothetical protein JL09_g1994 [Pichia kudriavzevii]
MDSTESLIGMRRLLENLLSPDNSVRIQSELEFKHFMESDANSLSYLLIQTALDDSLALATRQSALLQIKRIVPLVWSPAFDKFVGPTPINQKIKGILRNSLLKLVADPDSKIRSSASYAIVQIAAVDYPDEWPELLGHLYDSTTNPDSSMFNIIGSLSVLQEIFDDIVTDQQFFEGGVAIQVLKTCETLLQNKFNSAEVKVETLRLLKSLCQSFDNADFDINGREQFCNSVIPQIYQLVISTSKNVSAEPFVNSLTAWELKYETYYILDYFMNSFSNLLESFASASFNLLLQDFSVQSEVYQQLLMSDIDTIEFDKIFTDVKQFYSSQRERKEPYPFLTTSMSKEVEFMQTLIEIQNVDNPVHLSNILDLLAHVSILPSSKIEDYNSDFNQFVTDESGLNVEIAIRDSIRELLSDINENANHILIDLLMEKLNKLGDLKANQLKAETIVFLLSCCFENDDTIVQAPSFDLEKFLNSSLNLLLSGYIVSEKFQFLAARFILMIPRFLFKFANKCKQFGVSAFTKICSVISKLGGVDDFFIVKSSILISLQYYNYFIRAKEFGTLVQNELLGLVTQVSTEATEDTNMTLLDVMTIIISIDNLELTKNSHTIELILTIGFKNDSNFTMSSAMFECIEDILKDIPKPNYDDIVSFVFPFLLQKIVEVKEEYSSDIDLCLQVLGSFLKVNSSYQIPGEIFYNTFSVINKFILVCQDDELIQSSTEALIELVRHSPELCSKFIDPETKETGIQILLRNTAKLLSPDMSDRAIVKLGDLVNLLITNFNQSIGSYLDEILRALTVRLVHATEVPTIENMILIFNALTISQPSSTINFLKSFMIDGKPALVKVLPLWFQAYEVMRGYDSILSNVRAFIEIYKLNDRDIKGIVVDGDPLPQQVPDGIIVTRSIAKRMSIKYKQIPADAKIVSLLLEELKNEITAGDHGAAVGHIRDVDNDNDYDDVDDDDDDGWEDVEDLGRQTLDQLKDYVDEQKSLKRDRVGNNDDMKELLISFFKECTVQNTSNFEDIYNQFMSDNQRKLLSEYLLFT